MKKLRHVLLLALILAPATARGENGGAGAVTALYSPDSKRASRDEVEHFVWKPVPKPAEDNSLKSIRLSF